MTLKYQLVTRPNENFDKHELKRNQQLLSKFNQIKISNTDEDGNTVAELNDIKTRIDRYIKSSRGTVKSILEQPEVIKEIHVTSERSWTMYPEFIDEESGRTRYSPKQEYLIDQKLPYKRDGKEKLKDVVKGVEDKAMQKLREYRKKRQEVSFMDKNYTPRVLMDIGIDIKPTYRVHAGGGFGEGSNNYFIHMKGGTFVELAEVAKMRKIFEPKKPVTDAHHVGVEIEFVSKFDKYHIAKELMKEKVQDFVFLTEDGSLRKEGEFKHCHELTVLAPEQMIHEVLRRVLKAINTNDSSRVMNRCGLHVHLDMRNRDKKLAFYNLQKAQRILFAMNPRSRTDGTKADGTVADTVYSKRIDVTDFEEAFNMQTVKKDRYYGINALAIQKHNTIEIRIHSGSTNYEKISNWIKILTTIVNKTTKVNTEAAKAETFCDNYGLDNTILEYIKERINKFKDKDGKHISIEEVA